MIRHVSLLKFTEAGAREMSKSPGRAAGFAEPVATEGVEVEAQRWAAGGYDGLIVWPGRTEGAVLRALVRLSEHGCVRTESMRAFDAGKMAGVVGGPGRPPQRKRRK